MLPLYSTARSIEPRSLLISRQVSESKPGRHVTLSLQVDSHLSDRTALDARCGADATSTEQLAHTADDQTQHTVERNADVADHTRSCQPEYASDYREDSKRMPREGPGVQSVQATYGGLSMPASHNLLGTGGAQPSPGVAFCSHFEDALGEAQGKEKIHPMKDGSPLLGRRMLRPPSCTSIRPLD